MKSYRWPFWEGTVSDFVNRSMDLSDCGLGRYDKKDICRILNDEEFKWFVYKNYAIEICPYSDGDDAIFDVCFYREAA